VCVRVCVCIESERERGGVFNELCFFLFVVTSRRGTGGPLGYI